MEWTSEAILLGHLLITGVSEQIVEGSLPLTWALEWAAGYTDRFGVTFIDFESEEKIRYPKRSATVLKEIFANMIETKS